MQYTRMLAVLVVALAGCSQPTYEEAVQRFKTEEEALELASKSYTEVKEAYDDKIFKAMSKRDYTEQAAETMHVPVSGGSDTTSALEEADAYRRSLDAGGASALPDLQRVAANRFFQKYPAWAGILMRTYDEYRTSCDEVQKQYGGTLSKLKAELDEQQLRTANAKQLRDSLAPVAAK